MLVRMPVQAILAWALYSLQQIIHRLRYIVNTDFLMYFSYLAIGAWGLLSTTVTLLCFFATLVIQSVKSPKKKLVNFYKNA